MKKLILVITFLFAPQVIAQQTGTLIIEVLGFESDKGKLWFGLDKASDGFLVNPPFRYANPIITDNSVLIKIENVPFGDYAIRLFHDENDNGELDTNFLGIPVEAYGFSNDARVLIGAPGYDQARFEFLEDSTTHVITVDTHL